MPVSPGVSGMQPRDPCRPWRKDVGSVKYALVPVWILTTRYKDQPYTFMMNGQTGKFVGSLPWDKGKATKYQALATLIPLPIVYFIAKFLLG